MNIPTPAKVASNRTARLVAEMNTPVYTSTSGVANAEEISYLQDRLCTDEFCFVCNRCTDHWGEHTDEQILRAAKRMRIQA